MLCVGAPRQEADAHIFVQVQISLDRRDIHCTYVSSVHMIFFHLLLEKMHRMNCCCTELQEQVGNFPLSRILLLTLSETELYYFFSPIG